MDAILSLPFAAMLATWWPYIGTLNIICAIIGYFISGVLGLLLGLFLGPIGLLIALLLPKRTAI